MARSNEFLLAGIVVACALALRLFPYLSSGVPYMTDTWPQISNADVLLSNTPVPLVPAHGFDSYNVFWPGLTIFTAVLSVITTVKPLALMPVATPLVNALAFLILYALLRRMGFSSLRSFVASLVSGLALGSAIMGAGVTKEAYAFPLLFSFVLLLWTGLETGRASFLALSLLTFVSLLLSHHLTSVMALLVGVYLVVHSASSGKGGIGRAFFASVGLLLLMVGLTAYYIFVHASSVVLFVLTDSAVVSMLAYEFVFLLPVVIGIAALRSRRLLGGWAALAILSVVVVVAGASRFPVTADAPVVSLAPVLAAAPYVVIVCLASYAVLRLRLDEWRGGLGFFGFWGIGLLGVAYFVTFGTSGVLVTALRIADFVYPALVVLVAATMTAWMGRRVARIGVCALIAFIVLSSVAGVVWTADYSGPQGGTQHAYTQGDVSAAGWVARNLQANVTLFGDDRFSYLLGAFPGVKVDIAGGYAFLTRPSSPPSGCLLLSSLVYQVGYVAFDYGIPVRGSLLDLSNRSSASSVYDSGLDSAYCFAA